jgi:phytoene dehydrogenase-like protein
MKVVIVGAGHNGLVASAILAKKGFNVTVLEANEKIGGMTDTIEVKGVRISRASYVLGLMPEFLVEEFKIPLVKGDVFQTFFVNNKVIPFWRDEKKRKEEMVKVGETKYPEFEELILNFKKLMEEKFTYVDKPPSKDEVLEEAEKKGLEVFITTSAKKFLSEYISEDYHYFFIYHGMERAPAYVIAYYFSPNWALVRGGMGTVAERIAEYAISYGAEIRTGIKVVDLVEKGDRIVGVVTSDGKIIDADVVVISTSPLVFSDYLGIKLELDYAGWKKYNAILSEYPKFPQQLKGFEYSLIDTEFGEVIFPSILDDSRGGIVIESMADIDELENIFQGLRKNIIYLEELNSRNAEKIYNLPFGNLNHLPMTSNFLFDKRLGYKTKYDNVYLASAGTYPGGQVTGIPGYNVANLIIKTYQC